MYNSISNQFYTQSLNRKRSTAILMLSGNKCEWSTATHDCSKKLVSFFKCRVGGAQLTRSWRRRDEFGRHKDWNATKTDVNPNRGNLRMSCLIYRSCSRDIGLIGDRLQVRIIGWINTVFQDSGKRSAYPWVTRIKRSVLC